MGLGEGVDPKQSLPPVKRRLCHPGAMESHWTETQAGAEDPFFKDSMDKVTPSTHGNVAPSINSLTMPSA